MHDIDRQYMILRTHDIDTTASKIQADIFLHMKRVDIFLPFKYQADIFFTYEEGKYFLR